MGKVVSLKPMLKIDSVAPAEIGASGWSIWKEKARESVGSLLCRLGLPGFIKQLNYDDPLTGQQISISSSSLFTKLSVNGRDYYFDRITGKFDGTGMGCSR